MTDEEEKEFYADPVMTATEIIRKQAMAQKQAQDFINETVKNVVNGSIAELNKAYELQKRAGQLQDELMASNPQYSSTTIEIAKVILKTHDKANSLVDSYEVILPFVMSVAHDIEIEIERRLPKEWQNDR